MKIPLLATYRLQLRSGIGFAQVENILGYLKELGISHLYFSPYLQAMPESEHGYDVVNPTAVDSTLGGKKAHASLCEKLRELHLGQVIDVVPNHMAISKGENPWWWDVLENGASSRYASFFDVDWDFSGERWPNKILLPILGDQYGRILENKQFQLTYEGGLFILHYENHRLPIDPSSISDLLQRANLSAQSDILAFLAEACEHLPKPQASDIAFAANRDRDKRIIQDMLAKLCKKEISVFNAIDACVAKLNQNPDELDILLEKQNYRLSYWKMANRDLGYRRFFDIKDLVGLRVEDHATFLMLHALPLAWIKKDWVQGLRIDHPDGLRFPSDYFRKLRKECPNTWIVAEKILEPGEELACDWPIEGTTGYDFLQLVGSLFVDSKGKEAFTEIYKTITKNDESYKNIEHESKLFVLNQILESELIRLTNIFIIICDKHRCYRDYTRRDLREALCETCICFSVYRTYVSMPPNEIRKEDEHVISQAINEAIHNRSDLDAALFLFLKDILLLKSQDPLEEELAMRFQQLTGSVMAKGVEDTTFYRYNRFIALNEVGSNPDSFGISLDSFYEKCLMQQKNWPMTMLCTQTHDTKRSEDVRARLSLLSEIPERWKEVCQSWFTHNKKHHTDSFPDSNTEYHFYQTLVGSWPIETKRIHSYMEKAIREAKIHTTWTAPNPQYEKAVFDFVDAVLNDAAFIKNFENFVNELIYPGRINSLSQLLIKCTAPGIPDIYQGSEIWDLSLADPDNRRAVNFSHLEELLKVVQTANPQAILNGMDEGLPKLLVLYKCLAIRHEKLDSFSEQGTFSPLYAQGEKKEHAVAYMRGQDVIAIAPRLILGLDKDWLDTTIDIPQGLWRNVLSEETIQGGSMRLKDLFACFPVALLVKEQ